MDLQKLKENVPGTQAYENAHGLDQMHAAANQVKSYIPGTEAHQRSSSGDPAFHITNTGGQQTGPGSGLGLPGLEQAKEHIPGTTAHQAKKDRE